MFRYLVLPLAPFVLAVALPLRLAVGASSYYGSGEARLRLALLRLTVSLRRLRRRLAAALGRPERSGLVAQDRELLARRSAEQLAASLGVRLEPAPVYSVIVAATGRSAAWRIVGNRHQARLAIVVEPTRQVFGFVESGPPDAPRRHQCYRPLSRFGWVECDPFTGTPLVAHALGADHPVLRGGEIAPSTPAVPGPGVAGTAESALAEARQLGRLEGVQLAARELTHRLNNELTVPISTVEQLLESPDLPSNLRSSLNEVGTWLQAAAETLRRFARVNRVVTKETLVGPALDLDASSDPPP